jgi:ubiquitin C-terminal hydrolase
LKVASVPLDYRPLSFGTFSLICCILMILQVQCTACSNVSDQYENMMDLTVEIHGDAVSLEECLDQFTAKEWLQGDNLYKCDRCDDYVKACKRLSIRCAPNILTIALKRFQVWAPLSSLLLLVSLLAFS